MISYGGEDGGGLIFLTVGFLGTSLGYCNGSTSGASLGVFGGGGVKDWSTTFCCKQQFSRGLDIIKICM